jgi:hypothetical protein
LKDGNMTTWLASGVAALRNIRETGGGRLETYLKAYGALQYMIHQIKASQQFTEHQRELLGMIDKEMEQIGREAQ